MWKKRYRYISIKKSLKNINKIEKGDPIDKSEVINISVGWRAPALMRRWGPVGPQPS